MSETHDWTLGLPTLYVQSHRAGYGNGVSISLTVGHLSNYGTDEPLITFVIEREALADPRMELGACWTLTPGLRPPCRSELLAAAREALAAVGGRYEDIDKLSAEQRELLYDDDGGPLWDSTK